MSSTAKGLLAIIATGTSWGLFPIYFKALAAVPAIEVLAHRTLWSLLTFALVLAVQGRLRLLPAALGSTRRALVILAAAMTIASNWFLFVFAIQSSHAVQASLGYYFMPLLTVLLGRLVFGEKLGLLQWVAVGLALLAVLVLTLGLGVAPWISLGLATSFAAYAMIKKGLDVGPVVSVTAEVLLLMPLALIVLYLAHSGGGGYFGSSWKYTLLLMLSGLFTAGPLILFSYATRRLNLSTVGLVLYINPTLQFLTATLIFVEPFGRWHLIAFAMIWTALALYTGASWRDSRALRKQRVSSEVEPQLLTNPSSEGSAKP